MPYTKENPPDKIKGLPAHAQDIWVSAFNSAYENTPEGRDKEEYAAKVAWSAVEKAGYEKNEEGDWIKIKEEEKIDRGDKPLEKIRMKEAIALEGEKIKPHVFRVELMNLEEPNVKQRGWSENNKYYSDRALESLAKLMENKRSMATGHHDGEHLRELGGILKNVRKIPEKKIVEADYKILHQNPDWLESVITEQTNSPGANLTTLSIVAKGSGFRGERGGRSGEIIENIHRAVGCDIVFDAAAGGKFKSLLESNRRKKMLDVTLEELKEERPDLVEKILQEDKKKITDLETKVNDLDGKLKLTESEKTARKLLAESKLTEEQAAGLMRTMIGKPEEEIKQIIEERKNLIRAIAEPVKITNLTEKDETKPVVITESERKVWTQQGFTEEKMVGLKKKQMGIQEIKK